MRSHISHQSSVLRQHNVSCLFSWMARIIRRRFMLANHCLSMWISVSLVSLMKTEILRTCSSLSGYIFKSNLSFRSIMIRFLWWLVQTLHPAKSSLPTLNKSICLSSISGHTFATLLELICQHHLAMQTKNNQTLLTSLKWSNTSTTTAMTWWSLSSFISENNSKYQTIHKFSKTQKNSNKKTSIKKQSRFSMIIRICSQS